MFHHHFDGCDHPAVAEGRATTSDRDRGFTLIELLVVIVIVGILAAIAIPAFLAQRKTATDATIQSDLANAAIVMESYSAAHNGSYIGVTTSVLRGPDWHVRTSPSNVIDLESVTSTTYVLTAYNEQAGKSRTWRLTSGVITGPGA